jgi:hypothetical protein
MREQRKLVICQNIAQIKFGVMGFATYAMGAQVRHDDAVPRIGQSCSMAIFYPIGIRFGHEPVDQQQRPPLPRLAPRDLDAIGGL